MEIYVRKVILTIAAAGLCAGLASPVLAKDGCGFGGYKNKKTGRCVSNAEANRIVRELSEKARKSAKPTKPSKRTKPSRTISQ